MTMLRDRTRPVEDVQIVEASLDDLDRIAALHLECLGPKANLASLLGPSFVRAAYRWFITADEAYVIKATVGGEVAGFTSICDVPYTLPMLVACKRQALRALLRRPWLLANPRLVQRFLRRRGGAGLQGTTPGIAQVGFTAVSPRHRGRGIGTCLKIASIRTARQRGSRGLLTGISRENHASIALNQRFGFREVEEAATPAFRYYLLRFTPLEAPATVEEGASLEPARLPHGLTVQGP